MISKINKYLMNSESNLSPKIQTPYKATNKRWNSAAKCPEIFAPNLLSTSSGSSPFIPKSIENQMKLMDWSGIKLFFDNSTIGDFRFISNQDEPVWVAIAALKAISNYFLRLFNENIYLVSEGCIIIDEETSILRMALGYIFGACSFDINFSNLGGLWELGEKFESIGIIYKCKNFLSENVRIAEAVKIYERAYFEQLIPEQHLPISLRDSQRLSERIASNILEEQNIACTILEQGYFQDCSQHSLNILVRNAFRKMRAERQEIIIANLVHWITPKRINKTPIQVDHLNEKAKFVRSLLTKSQINLEDLSLKFTMSVIYPSNLVTQTEFLQIFLWISHRLEFERMMNLKTQIVLRQKSKVLDIFGRILKSIEGANIKPKVQIGGRTEEREEKKSTNIDKKDSIETTDSTETTNTNTSKSKLTTINLPTRTKELFNQINEMKYSIDNLRHFVSEFGGQIRQIESMNEQHMDYFSRGIHINVGLGKLKDLGFKVALYQSFDQKFNPVDLQYLKKFQNPKALVCIGCCLFNSNLLSLAGFGLAHKIFVKTTSLRKSGNLHRGVYWYMKEDIAFGFSPDDQINIESGVDKHNPTDQYRLCWTAARRQVRVGNNILDGHYWKRIVLICDKPNQHFNINL